jgi:2-polyprenyl-3-methyl-5-hydroxy-6-metoxy-1,4-benzoquinol methylase
MSDNYATVTSFNANGKYCPFCEGGKLDMYSVNNSTGKGRLSIVECQSCRVAWQWPVISEENDGTAFFDENYLANSSTDDKYFDAEQRREVATMQGNFVKEISENTGDLLDVGAGMGLFVNVAKEFGWNAVGIEPSSGGVTTSKLLGEESILNCMISDLPKEPTYNVITMWDVIEHVENPVLLIQEAFDRLAEGGWLVIETGNFQSRSRIELSENWWLWQSDHRWYLAPNVVESVLAGIGFKHFIHANTVFRPHFRNNSQQDNLIKRYLKKTIRKPWHFRTNLRKLRDLNYAYKNWPSWVELPIFTIAAQKSGN